MTVLASVSATVEHAQTEPSRGPEAFQPISTCTGVVTLALASAGDNRGGAGAEGPKKSSSSTASHFTAGRSQLSSCPMHLSRISAYLGVPYTDAALHYTRPDSWVDIAQLLFHHSC